jgi:hypothetical protein
MCLANIAAMTSTTADRTAQPPFRLHVLKPRPEPTETPGALPVARRVPHRAAARRRRPASLRPLLRLAPPLALVKGIRGRPDWRVVAGGVGAAVADHDVDDSPWIA